MDSVLSSKVGPGGCQMSHLAKGQPIGILIINCG